MFCWALAKECHAEQGDDRVTDALCIAGAVLQRLQVVHLLVGCPGAPSFDLVVLLQILQVILPHIIHVLSRLNRFGGNCGGRVVVMVWGFIPLPLNSPGRGCGPLCPLSSAPA